MIITAPTGAGAVNIKRNTIHSKFKLPVNASAFEDLKDAALHEFELRYKKLKFILIDRKSIVGARLLHQIKKRCQNIYLNVNEDFGGLHVYMLGDFRQLPPVKDTPLYDDKFTDSMASNGSLIF